MKKITIISIILIISMVVGIFFFINQKWKKNNLDEIMPQEEISEEQLRNTMVSLYYVNKNNEELMPEIRLIDVKDLIEEPYKKIIDLLIEEPKNSNLKSAIPEGTKINKIEIRADIIYIDFSKEFIENHNGGLVEEKNTIYSLVNSLTEFTEINGIKILIENEENKEFKDGIIKFNETFTKLNN